MKILNVKKVKIIDKKSTKKKVKKADAPSGDGLEAKDVEAWVKEAQRLLENARSIALKSLNSPNFTLKFAKKANGVIQALSKPF